MAEGREMAEPVRLLIWISDDVGYPERPDTDLLCVYLGPESPHPGNAPKGPRRIDKFMGWDYEL
jgi:hypothetical protein